MEDKVKKLLTQLEDGVKEVFDSEKYKNYLKTMSNFHNYSFNNTLLICMQNPNASLVAGFNTWKKLKRIVNKGEKGIAILAPCNFKAYIEKDKLDPDTNNPIINANTGEIEKIKVPAMPNRFRTVHVFDINQTKGEPIPNLVEELKGNIKDYKNFIESLKAISIFPVKFENIDGECKGYCDFKDRIIAIKTGMDEKQIVKTAIHEIAHSILHGKENSDIDRKTAEVQAESVAFVVCNYYGIDTKDYSFGYVAGWSENKDIKELKNSLSVIQKTSNSLINQINEKVKELVKSKDVIEVKKDRKSLKDIENQIKDYKQNTAMKQDKQSLTQRICNER
ncbi:ArdC family protein [Sedimentibacter sp. MB31-C6]|uniref:ArdC family protein n=1 Tax=Sedimentibacter sp. MB31-C6 TaxID=3109366 RepID=UPI002DDD00D7|nr:ArdC family protein [Sedimentibacter sp. MB36-C1]WSI05141.1 ArdC family protein [Sedimentibacter sp. MB36-C1]